MVKGKEAFQWFFVPTYNKEEVGKEFLNLCKTYYRIKNLKSDEDLSKIYGNLLWQTINSFIERFDGHMHYNEELESITITYYRYNGGEEFTFIIDLKTGRVKE